jgi:hypothetical protein
MAHYLSGITATVDVGYVSGIVRRISVDGTYHSARWQRRIELSSEPVKTSHYRRYNAAWRTRRD